MMFQGSKNLGESKHFDYIQKAGGILNGTTSTDRTNYYETVSSSHLELVLWLEADRMGWLNVTQSNFDNQREVVIEEKRQRYDNIPYGTCIIELNKRLYQEHPYKWMPIGEIEHLKNSSLTYAQNFYIKFYNPKNAVLVISGDIDYPETETLVRKYYSEIHSNDFPKRDFPSVIYNQGEITDTIFDNIQLPAIVIGYKLPSITSEDYYPLYLLSSILGNGKSSRLYHKLVYEEKLVSDISCAIWEKELSGTLVIFTTGFPDTDMKTVSERITEIIDRTATEPVSERELEKTKNKFESEFVSESSTNFGVSNLLAHYHTFYGNAELINSDWLNYLKVSKEQITDTAFRYLQKNNRVVLFYKSLNSK
jgi:predicted Zn-dependent peptidase